MYVTSLSDRFFTILLATLTIKDIVCKFIIFQKVILQMKKRTKIICFLESGV